MRLLVGEFAHESNVFCAGTTGFADFRLRWLEGPAVVEELRGTGTVVGGFVAAAEAGGHTLVPAIAAWALPSGPVAAEVWQAARERLLATAREAEPFDGVLLSLHGAMTVVDAAGVADPEGELVAAVRQAVGPGPAIVVVLDPHSDTTDLLLEAADLTLAYNEEPHRDAHERGVEAVGLLEAIRAGRVRPARARERAPLFLPAINLATDEGPMHDLHRLRAELEALPGVLDLSIHGGFYGSDQPEAGFSVVCATDGDPALARRLARQVAAEAWRRRAEFVVPLVPVEEAVRVALAAGEPVGLVDECDDPAGGGAGDSVAILRGMLAGGVSAGGVSAVKDAEVARAMRAAGEGATLSVVLGAKSDSLHGESIAVTGTVRRLHTGPVATDDWSGTTYGAGIIGVLDVAGVLVVVTEEKLVTENTDLFATLGFDVRTMQAVCCKGLGLHIRQALAGKVGQFVPVDAVGPTHPDVRRLGEFRRLRRPVWPLDAMADDAYP